MKVPTVTANKDDTWVVVPCFNEDAHEINHVLQGLVGQGWSVVVVDDGSTEPLLSAISMSGVHVCRHVINLGQGAALQTGIDFALSKGAQYLVTFDSDGQHSAADIPKLLHPLMTEDFDVVLGSRFLKDGQALNIPFRKFITLKLAVWFTRLTTGLQLTDTHNGLRAMSRNSAMRFQITQNRMSHASQILRYIKTLHLKYTEVPVTVVYTDYSVKKGQRISNAFNIVWESLADRLV